MLKISTSTVSPQQTILLLEGRVVEATLPLLNRSCDQAFAEELSLTLDMTGVTFLDRKGIAFLLMLADRGVRIVNTSAFVAEQLKLTQR